MSFVEQNVVACNRVSQYDRIVTYLSVGKVRYISVLVFHFLTGRLTWKVIWNQRSKCFIQQRVKSFEIIIKSTHPLTLAQCHRFINAFANKIHHLCAALLLVSSLFNCAHSWFIPRHFKVHRQWNEPKHLSQFVCDIVWLWLNGLSDLWLRFFAR